MSVQTLRRTLESVSKIGEWNKDYFQDHSPYPRHYITFEEKILEDFYLQGEESIFGRWGYGIWGAT